MDFFFFFLFTLLKFTLPYKNLIVIEKYTIFVGLVHCIQCIVISNISELLIREMSKNFKVISASNLLIKLFLIDF